MLSSSPRAVFAALKHRNFRLFLTGQFISLCGTWMQTIAQGWLVLHLTNSAFAVGLVTALGSLPILLFTLYGGVIADRVNKRRFIMVLQSLMLLEALTLGVLTALDLITVEWVMGLAVFFGFLTAFEVPARQAFVAEIVDRDDLMNAIALGSSAFNLARVIGPALAGVLIATLGLPACFFANAVSYLAVIVSLTRMQVPDTASSQRYSLVDRPGGRVRLYLRQTLAPGAGNHRHDIQHLRLFLHAPHAGVCSRCAGARRQRLRCDGRRHRAWCSGGRIFHGGIRRPGAAITAGAGLLGSLRDGAHWRLHGTELLVCSSRCLLSVAASWRSTESRPIPCFRPKHLTSCVAG